VLAAPAAQQGGDNEGKYADDFVTKLASLLNVDKNTLVTDMKQAASATVDDAAAAGDVSPNQATRLKERIESGDFSHMGHGMGHGQQGEMHAKMMANRDAIMGALASKLGITTDELQKQLHQGKTLHRIGTEHNVSDQDLKAAILSVVQPQLAEAVKNGDLSQKQAEAVVKRVQSADLDLARGVPGMGGGMGYRGHHGVKPKTDQSGDTGQQ
jgi:ribosomal protein S20